MFVNKHTTTLQPESPVDFELGSAGKTMHQVLDSNLIAAPEGRAIGFAVTVRNRRMPILVTVFHGRRTMIFIVLTRTLDAVMEALSLHSL